MELLVRCLAIAICGRCYAIVYAPENNCNRLRLRTLIDTGHIRPSRKVQDPLCLFTLRAHYIFRWKSRPISPGVHLLPESQAAARSPGHGSCVRRAAKLDHGRHGWLDNRRRVHPIGCPFKLPALALHRDCFESCGDTNARVEDHAIVRGLLVASHW